MKNLSFRFLITFSMAVVLSGNVSGQVLEEVLVTAQRRAESLQDVPVSISTFSGRVLEEREIVSFEQFDALVPNLYVDGAIGSDAFPRFFFRGLGTADFNATTNTPVTVSNDEVVYSNPYLQGMPAFDLERVEILRGPQGTLWGKNTTGGAVHFITNKPTHEFEAKGKFTYGRFEQMDFEGAVNGSIIENLLAARVSIQRRNRDGYLINDFDGGDLQSIDDSAGRLQLLFTPNENFSALLKLHARAFDGHSVPFINAGLPLGVANASGPLGSNRSTNQDWTDPYLDVEQRGGVLTINWDVGGLTLTSITAYEENETETTFDDDGGPIPTEASFISADIEQFSQEVRLASNYDGALNWILGLHYFDDELENYFAYPTFDDGAFGGFGSVSTELTQNNDSFAVFANGTYDVTDRLRIIGGVRWTTESKDMDLSVYSWLDINELSPFDYRLASSTPNLDGVATPDETWKELAGDVSAVFSINDDINVYAKYSHGFKAGAFNGGVCCLYGVFAPGPPIDLTDGISVHPEFLDSYEVGIKSELLGRRLRLNLTGYYYDYSDIQVFILAPNPAGAGFLTLYENAAAGEVLGFELESDFYATEGLLLSFSLGYTDSEYTDDYFVANPASPAPVNAKGNPFPKTADWTIHPSVSYDFSLGSWHGNISTNWNYRSKVFFRPAQNLGPRTEGLREDGFWRGEARLSIRTPEENFGVTLWVKNITDENKTVTAYGPFAGTFLQARTVPRTFGVTLSSSWN